MTSNDQLQKTWKKAPPNVTGRSKIKGVLKYHSHTIQMHNLLKNWAGLRAGIRIWDSRVRSW
jgi:hypothetical protein